MNFPTTLYCMGLMSIAAAGRASEFETESWPGEGVPVLISASDKLTLRQSPHLDALSRTIDYRTGWKVPFDKSLYRTTNPATIVVRQSATIEIWCDGPVNYEFEAGQKLVYLQYRAEGFGTVRIDGRICEVPLRLEEAVFGSNFDEPDTLWWVRVTFADGSSPGWLNVMDGQVSFGDREF